MHPAYYVIDTATNTPIPAVIRPAAWRDLQKTEKSIGRQVGFPSSFSRMRWRNMRLSFAN